jgi:hypothetical protein
LGAVPISQTRETRLAFSRTYQNMQEMNSHGQESIFFDPKVIFSPAVRLGISFALGKSAD